MFEHFELESGTIEKCIILESCAAFEMERNEFFQCSITRYFVQNSNKPIKKIAYVC